ncbi:MAG: LysM protein [Sphingobacteriales bacterium]|nr:LysM protein [Sphingobacteriales bacterium]
MLYTIKSGDTLSKIANRYKVPVFALLASNAEIKNPDHVFVGQIIKVPNIEDMPEDAEFEVPVLREQIVLRARSVVGCDIRYKLGSGGLNPGHNLPSHNKLCDCSGFVCWVLGLSRKTDIPFYKQHGGWIYTDSMVDDVNSSAGIFERLNFPEPGCIVVYGAGKKIGHVGIVSEVTDGTMKNVIHCSHGNSNRFNAAIQETAPTVFNRPDAIWGKFVG